ncbi:MAG TPA: hypothetical protein P5081_12305 [Phycisphaerae bacterium]|nr:hypothetical protein [Phycisphaerae bacterium]
MQLFSGPTPAPDIYGPRGHLGKIILIGDDYQGYCFGFAAPAGFAMVEITPAGEARFLNKSFVDFMLSRTTSTQ